MRHFILITMVNFSLFISNTVLGQPNDVFGWNKSRWGMTEEEILETFKSQAERLDKMETYQGGYKNYYALIGIDNFDILGDNYKIRFLMDESKTLAKVLIKVEGDDPSETRYRILEQLLVEKYGPPSYKYEGKESTELIHSITSITMSWNFPSTIIEIKYVEITGIVRDLTISYYPPRKEIYDKI